jgi:hypothetical protein
MAVRSALRTGRTLLPRNIEEITSSLSAVWYFRDRKQEICSTRCWHAANSTWAYLYFLCLSANAEMTSKFVTGWFKRTSHNLSVSKLNPSAVNIAKLCRYTSERMCAEGSIMSSQFAHPGEPVGRYRQTVSLQNLLSSYPHAGMPYCAPNWLRSRRW